MLNVLIYFMKEIYVQLFFSSLVCMHALYAVFKILPALNGYCYFNAFYRALFTRNINMPAAAYLKMFLLSILFCLAAILPQKTAAQTVGIPLVSGAPVCAGSTVSLSFSVTNGNGVPSRYTNTTVYTIYLSTAAGTAPYTSLGTFNTTGVTYSNSNGGITNGITRTVTIPLATATGSGYKIAIGSSTPTFTGSNGANASLAFTITAPPSATIAYNGTPYCSNNGTAFVTRTGTTGGTYTKTAGAGTLSLDASSGDISLGTSTAGTYTVTYTIAAVGGCTQFTTAASLTIVAPPSSLNYAANPVVYCNGTAITSNTPSNSGGAPASYAVSPALPAGLNLNTGTGIISGTPAAASAAADYTVTAINSCGSTSVAVNISVSVAAPTALTYSSNTVAYCFGVPITNNLPSNSGGAPTTYSVSPTLPAGLNVDPFTGIISGTPAAISASANYTVTAANSCGFTTRDVNISVTSAAPSITYSDNPAAYCPGAAITLNIPFNGGGAASSYSVSPALPAGLSLNTVTGIISGIPTATAAAADYTITATNSCGTNNVIVNITISAAAPTALTYTANTVSYCNGVTITNNLPTNSGGVPTAYTVSPALPAGLVLDPVSGIISGTPAGAAAAANYTITAANSCGFTAKAVNIAVTIAPASLTYSVNPVVYCPGSAITANTPSNNGGTAISYSVNPALPAGLNLNTATGIISGTPSSVTAASNYMVTATNSCGFTSVAVNITIAGAAPTALTYASNTVSYCLGFPITNNSPSSSGGAPTAYTVSPALPAGLVLDPVSGIISGIPFAISAAANYTVTAANSCGNANRAVNIIVFGIPTVNAGTPVITCSDSAQTASGVSAVNITSGSSATNNNSVLWSSSGTGTFTNATSLITATYRPSAADKAAGAVILTLTAFGNSPCGNATSTKILTITPAIDANSTNNWVQTPNCNGLGVQFILPGTPGGGNGSFSYQWMAKNNCGVAGVSTPVPGATNPSFIPPSTDCYWLLVSSGGCSVPQNLVAGTNRQRPSSTTGDSANIKFGVGGSNPKICIGSSTNLTASSAVSYTYSWSPATGLSSTTGSTVTANPAVTTIYTVTATATDASGCFKTAKDTVTVNPLATLTGVSANTVCTGANATVTLNGLLANSTSAVSYKIGSGSVQNVNALASNGSGIATFTLPLNYSDSGQNFTITSIASSINGGPACIQNFNSGNSTILTVFPNTVGGTIPSVSACSGGSNTISLSGNVGNVTQWESSTNGGISWTPIANTTTSLLYTIAAQTTLYRALVKSGACAAAYSTVATTGLHNVWAGTVSNNWQTASNWSDGLLPSTSCPNVTIPAGTTYSPILGSGTATINNLVINPTASLTVSGAKLFIAGTISNSGSFDAGNGSIEFNGSATQNVAGNMFAGNTIKDLALSNPNGLVVSNSAGNLLNIKGDLAFGNVNNSTLNTGDNVVLLSTALGTARLADITNNGTNTGNAVSGKMVIQRFIPGRRAWRLLTAPVTAGSMVKISDCWQESAARVTNPSVINAANNPNPGYGTHITFGNPATNGYDQGINGNTSIRYLTGTGWDGVPTATNNGSILNSGYVTDQPGYFVFVRGDRGTLLSQGTGSATSPTILRMKGSINTGLLDIPLTSSYVNGSSNFRVVGNPYPSAINFHKLIQNGANVSGAFADAFYLWDPNITGNNGVGGWVALSYNSGTGLYDRSVLTSGPSSIANTGDIQSGSAFVIDYTGASTGIRIQEPNKVTGSNITQFRPVRQVRASLLANNADNSVSVNDAALVTFDTAYHNEVDAEDVKKLPNFSENFGLITGGTKLAIERRKPVSTIDTIFFSMTQLKQKNYQLELTMEEINAPTGTAAFLEDVFLDTKTPVSIKDTSRYDFSVIPNTSSANTERFRLVFRPSVYYLDISGYISNEDIMVAWKIADELNINRFEIERSVDGISFTTAASSPGKGKSTTAVSYSWTDINPAPGNYYYRIKSISNNGVIAYSSVVNIRKVNTKKGIFVFPNPVKGNTLFLQMNAVAIGSYTVKLFSSSGEWITAKTIYYSGGNSTQSIEFSPTVLSGSYQLELNGPGKTSTSLKIVIQK